MFNLARTDHRPPRSGVRQFRAAMAGLVCVALTTTGCTAAAKSSSPSTSGGSGSGDRKNTVVVAYNNEVTTLDPARSDYLQVDNVDQVLYDTLLTYQKGAMVPRLATTFTYAKDSKSVSIVLRSGATFHDGTPVTAKDVAYTLDRYHNLKVGISGQMPTYTSTTVTDDTHLTINLSQPDTLFMGALSRLWILNSALVKTNAGSDNGQGWLLNHDAGSGPYQLSTDNAGTFTTTRFDKYWGFLANRPTTMIYRRIDQHSTIAQELKAGTVDVGQIDASAVPTLQAAGIKTAPIPGGGQEIIYFNTSTGTAKNVAVRKAIRLAFDYKGALTSLYAGQGTIANGVTPTNMSCRPTEPTATQDLTAAKKVLTDAGLTNLTLTMRYQPVFTQQAQAATLLQSNLKEIGVTLNLQPIAFADYLTSLSSAATVPDIMLLAESAAYPDTGVMVTRTYWSKSVGTNKSAYSNPKVDSLIAQASADPDAAARCKLYAQAQALIYDDAASVALYTTPGLAGHRADIGGTDQLAAPGGIALSGLTVGN